MLLSQHLSHLLLLGADALFCLVHLALRFLTQLFGAFAELHALQLSDQRLQPVVLRMVVAAPATAPLAGRFGGSLDIE